MAKLNDEQRTFIVQQLACWRTPTEVAEAVMEEWPDLKMDRRQVEQYNPYRAGPPPAKKWTALFDATREAFQKEIGKLGIANQAYRLQELEDLYHRAKRLGALTQAAAILEQGAKECGKMYTNQRVLSGALGVVDLSQATDAQLDAILAGADPEEILESGQQRD